MKYLTKLSVLLIAALVVALCLFASPTKANAATSGYYTYEVSDGKATITDVSTSISGAITIPSTLGGYPVTTIGSSAFEYCYSLTSVTIPDSVNSIGEYAFFYCDSLTSVTIPDSVTSIGSSAFDLCTSLTSVTIPDSVTSIGDYAFRSCTSLTGIYVDANNPNYSSDAYGVLFSKDKTQLIQAPGGLSSSYSIPDSVTSIGYSAFYYCTSLTSVTIPNSVTSIGSSAFCYCDSLTSVTIPNSVTSIGSSAFWCCSSLTSVTIPDSVTSIGYGAFYNCKSLTSVTIPDSVTSIGEIAFDSCYSLTSVIIGNSVSYIEDFAFSGCVSLTNVTIPDSVTSIGQSAFSSCKSLTSVTIPDSVTSIGYRAFSFCTCLTGIYVDDNNSNFSNDDYGVLYNKDKTQLNQAPGALMGSYCIPDSVTSIGDYAFYYCEGLTSVTIPDDLTSIGVCSFDGCDKLEYNLFDTGYYLGNSENPYVVLMDTVSTNCTSFEIHPNTKIIGYNAFSCCEKITSVTIPNGVTSISGSAFSGCTSLTSVTIPNSVTSIGHGAFSGNGLTGIYVDADNPNYSNDEYGVLFNKNKTKLIEFPRGLDVEYSIPDSVTFIGNFAFYGCDNLFSIAIPNSVISVGGHAFGACFNLTRVTIGNNVTSIGDYAFDHCSNLTSLTIPDSVTRIGAFAFDQCQCLTSVTYCGTEDQWYQIAISDYNFYLTSANRYFHNWNPATCTAPMTCTLCNITEGELSHSGIWIDLLEATCADNGIKARICNVCGTTESATVPALGHQWDSVVTSPTCTIDGYTTNTCAGCGIVTITDVVVAKGHGWSAWIQLIAPSCAKEGSQMRFCYCGVKETETLAKLPHNYADGVCTTCNQAMSGHMVLSADMNLPGLTLTEDLYIDLNSFSLSGVMNTNGYTVYGMDSTTNGYTFDTMGYFSCVDENGNAIIPETLYTTQDMMRYMTVETENGYTFHRFYLGITNISLAPSVTGFGYKAEFYGDEMVQAEIASIGYNLWLTEDVVISRTSAFKNTLTLRLKNFDVVNYGETPVNASVTITLTDGTVIESATASYSMRQVVEQLNESATDLDEAKLSAVASMIANNPTMQSWKVEKIYKKP